MTNTELLETIKHEIEGLTTNAHEMPKTAKYRDYYLGKDNAYSEILEFLDSLSVDAPEGLDEAAEEFAEGEWDGVAVDTDGNVLYSQDEIEYAFKAGAEWAFGQFEVVPNKYLGTKELYVKK